MGPELIFTPLPVARVDRLGPDAAAVTFEVPAAARARFDFRAGQWISLRRQVDGRDVRRSYSLCTPAGGSLTIAVREPAGGGLFSSWLVHRVRPGDQVEVSGPAGAFGQGAPTGRALFVAAGAGIAPVLSVVATRLRDPRARIRVVRVDRTPASALFTDELDRLRAEHPDRLTVTPVWTRTPGGSRPTPEGWRQLLAAGGPLSGASGVWLCGPPDLVAVLRPVLASLGVPHRRVHAELFDVPEPPAPDAVGVSTVRVVAGGRTTVATVPRSAWLLDAARGSRPDVPWSCLGGMCGICRARVADGEVDVVANHQLSAADVAAGAVLTCRTRPVSPLVTVDFDA
ncbi:2Fe-2S iron-sulfur cluster-binding protein [Modestobacter sp. NPDC049651]|uniref:2Fe-2S iron-sulfur cluster-binding protein n=1 Tax=unclassified Modestobacter TaxID=2643866 RepID=UPI0034080604